MEHLIMLRQQLEDVDKMISLFISCSGIKGTLNRMMDNRRKIIKRITRYQLRYFNRD